MYRSCCWAASRSRIWACTVTSSAVVGSSANSSLGPQASAIGDDDPLAHAAGELVRVLAEAALAVRGCRPTRSKRERGVDFACEALMSRLTCSDSVIWRPIFMTGLREVMGSWNTIAISVPHSSRYRRLGHADELARPRSAHCRCARRCAGQQAHDRPGEHRLAGARLADDAERVAAVEGERHVVDRPSQAARGAEARSARSDTSSRRSRRVPAPRASSSACADRASESGLTDVEAGADHVAEVVQRQHGEEDCHRRHDDGPRRLAQRAGRGLR